MPDRNDKAQIIGQEDKGPDYVPNISENNTISDPVVNQDPATAAILQEQGKDPIADAAELEPPTTVKNMLEGENGRPQIPEKPKKGYSATVPSETPKTNKKSKEAKEDSSKEE